MTTVSGKNDIQDWDIAVTKLDGRIGAIEASIGGIISEIRNLSGKLESKSQIQWPAIAVFLTVITMLSAVVWYPMSSNQTRAETSISRLTETAVSKDDAKSILTQITKLNDTVVSKEDFNLIINANKERRDDFQKNTDSRFARAEADIDYVQKSVVPRGELNEKWAGQREINDSLRRDLESTKQDLKSIYTPRDKMDELQKQVDALQLQLKLRDKTP